MTTSSSPSQSAVKRIEAAQGAFRSAFAIAIAFEALLIAALVLAADFSDPVHRLIVISAVGGYTIIVVSLIAAVSWIERSILRTLEFLPLQTS